ncbi:aldehyde dehydrogenase family protein [Pseudactinotalea suaedae]|uniref:aldehyde dehydrogenase family protein n=1 Tax=Pseudactinotalea suaedae TaxID=1524924 RepID=UPI0012E21C22|nr:aldehyde dehydrogenase family protein [Pseudactinotalea suaedae]
MTEYAVVDPATGVRHRRYPTATDAELADSLAQAWQCYRSDWSERAAAPERARLLHAVADAHLDQRDELARLIQLEMGKSVQGARGEVEFSADIYRYYADRASVFLADRPIELLSGPGVAVTRPSPVGPLLGIMPWNYPYYQVARFAAPNLLLGNPVLLKHAPQCPSSAEAIADILRSAGAPTGAYQDVRLDHDQVARAIADPRIRGVSLTGSDRAGAVVASHAGRHLKKVVLELGGSDPFLVLSGEDLDGVAAEAVRARISNVGQACNAAKRIIVLEEFYDRFRDLFVTHLRRAAEGLGPLSSASAAAAVAEQVERARAAGARVDVVRSPLNPGDAVVAVIDQIPAGSAVLQEEIFGPVAMLLRARNESDAVELANGTPYGLGSYVYSADPAQVQRVADRLEVGMVFVNCIDADGVETPFGGTKRSGFGRELGAAGVEEFMNHKLIRTTEDATEAGAVR